MVFEFPSTYMLQRWKMGLGLSLYMVSEDGRATCGASKLITGFIVDRMGWFRARSRFGTQLHSARHLQVLPGCFRVYHQVSFIVNACHNLNAYSSVTSLVPVSSSSSDPGTEPKNTLPDPFSSSPPTPDSVPLPT